MTNDNVNDPVANVRKTEHEAKQGTYADELRYQLARATAVEQPRDGTVDTIPASAVVGGPVGEQTHGDDAPEAVGAVDRDGADRIVDLKNALDELDADAYEKSSDKADDDGTDGADESAGRCNGDQSGEEAVPGHGRVGLAVAHPHVKQGTERTRATCQHRVDRDRPNSQRAIARRG